MRDSPLKLRRRRALERLLGQLSRGTKTRKRTHPLHNRADPLTFEDRERIKAEIRRLEQSA